MRELRIGVVVARFNPAVSQLLLDKCCGKLEELGVGGYGVHPVAGALEIPYMVKRLALDRGAGAPDAYDGFIALGCVIRGETYHFEVVANVSAQGLLDVQLEIMAPVANGILTVDDEGQAMRRAERKAVHCAHCVLSLLA